jgi:hypothetical protein
MARTLDLEEHSLELTMAEISTLNDPQHERDFRRGYARGAQSIIKAVGHKLSDTDREKLELWAANELSGWSTALDRTDFIPPELSTL